MTWVNDRLLREAASAIAVAEISLEEKHHEG
jgi:hypothetical protein